MYSHSKPNLNLDELYGKFLNAHRKLNGTVSGHQAVNLERAKSELSKLKQVIQILEDYKSRPEGDISKQLKMAMNYQDLEKRLQEEKERSDRAEKEAQETPYELTFDEMELLLRIFGHEGGGILHLSEASFFEKLKNLSQSTGNDEMKIVAKLGGKEKADEVTKNIINKIKHASANANWDEIKKKLSTGVKNVFEYKENQQIYETTLSQKNKLDTEIKQLMNPKTVDSRIGALKQKKEALSSYIQSIEKIKRVHDQYYTSFTTSKSTERLQTDIQALNNNIKTCQKESKQAKQQDVHKERLERLKSSKKVLSSLKKNGRLEEAIEQIENADKQQIRSFDTVLKELDEKFSAKEDRETLIVPHGLESSHGTELPKMNLEKNKQEIARLLTELDTLKVEGKVITKEEKKKWEEIEQRIEELEYENDTLEPSRPQKTNEEVIRSLKEAVRITIVQSQEKSEKTKETATRYFKNIKQVIKELRQEQEDTEIQQDNKGLIK
ncbi:hypothetical protein [Legionella tucsonensis]|uniref:Uncharacterized protein n=1 Tax=Legionella tucsonensis TaxID=40335 RepID=A0A0W0ZSU1_9GAMM|nr:hypothetical protein [Legionella tucsonensis]KTD72231.1 hypothetical protein Ltuc_0078 [Legionella tucsonensis]